MVRIELEKKPIYLGEPPDPWRDAKDINERARQVILFCLQASAEHYKRLRLNFDDYYDRYTAQPAKLRQTNRIKSNIPSGRATEIIDTFRADMMTKIQNNRPVISAVPQDSADQDQAQAREDLLQFQIDNFTPDMGAWPVFDQIVWSAFLFGGCPVKMAFEQRTMKENFAGLDVPLESLVYRGPVAIPVFIYDYFPHPRKTMMDDFYPAVHVSFESYDTLLKGKRDGVYLDTVDEIPEMSELPNMLGPDVLGCLGDMYQRADQRQRMGWTDEDKRLHQDGVLVLECETMFRPEVDWTDSKGRKHRGEEPVRSILTIANGLVIRVTPSPMRTGYSVWCMAKTDSLPGQFYGPSVLQKFKPQLHAEDLLLNMALQNIGQIANKMKVVRPDLLHSASSLDDEPGGTIYLRPGASVNDAIREVSSQPLGNDVFNLMRYLADRIEGNSGQDELKSGRVPRGDVTATATNLAFAQSSIRFRYHLEWLGSSFFLPMARKMDAYNIDFLDLPFIHRVLGRQGAYINNVTEETFRVPVDYYFEGPTRDEHVTLKIAQLQNALKVMTPLVQLIPGMDAAAKEIVVSLLDRFETPNMDIIKQLIGYQQSTPMMDPAMGGAGQNVRPGAPAGPSMRRESRVPSLTGNTGIAKQLGGLLAGSARTR